MKPTTSISIPFSKGKTFIWPMSTLVFVTVDYLFISKN